MPLTSKGWSFTMCRTGTIDDDDDDAADDDDDDEGGEDESRRV